MAIQGSMAGMGYRGDHDGCTYEPGSGAQKKARYLHTSIPKGYGAVPGQ